jgi:GAF domain-containing protein
MVSFNYDDLEVLHDLARILATPLDLREQLEQVLKKLSEKTGMDRGMISILDRNSGEALLDVAYGVDSLTEQGPVVFWIAQSFPLSAYRSYMIRALRGFFPQTRLHFR